MKRSCKREKREGKSLRRTLSSIAQLDSESGKFGLCAARVDHGPIFCCALSPSRSQYLSDRKMEESEEVVGGRKERSEKKEREIYIYICVCIKNTPKED